MVSKGALTGVVERRGGLDGREATLVRHRIGDRQKSKGADHTGRQVRKPHVTALRKDVDGER